MSYEDLRETIEGKYNRVEELAKTIIGYKGYKDKEVRREADNPLGRPRQHDLEAGIVDRAHVGTCKAGGEQRRQGERAKASHLGRAELAR